MKSKLSSFLTPQEKLNFTHIFKSIESSCHIVATAIVQLFRSIGTQWTFVDEGVLYLFLDTNIDSYYLKLYELSNVNLVLWQHEIYKNFNYIAANKFFHMFEGDASIFAFNFADENEAKKFNRCVTNKILKRNNKLNFSWFSGLSFRKTQQQPSEISFNSSKKRKTTNSELKDAISLPLQFKHVTHVGHDHVFGEIENKTIVSELCKLLKLQDDLPSQEYITSYIAHEMRKSVRNFKRNGRNVPLPPPPQISWQIDDLNQEHSKNNGKLDFSQENRLRTIREKPEMARTLAVAMAKRNAFIQDYSDTDDESEDEWD